ncbi:hypothetical protein XACJJ10_1400067 [Xanthomonas citri pv. citri]|nr:hypothetical protein XACJJ10_1400067 [Xanthomonas citri pv. citri]
MPRPRPDVGALGIAEGGFLAAFGLEHGGLRLAIGAQDFRLTRAFGFEDLRTLCARPSSAPPSNRSGRAAAGRRGET